MARSLKQWKQILPESYHNELDRKYAEKINDNNATRSLADVEPVAGNGANVPNEVKAFAAQVRINIHSIRKRLADYDGVSGKGAIDGIVKAGVLQNDSPKFVKEVSYSQEQGEDCTIITITEA